MECPKFIVSFTKRNGIVSERQRYKCHDCGYNYTVELKSTAFSPSVKRQALQLYLQGLGFRSIGRFLGVSHVTETGKLLWEKLKKKEIGEVMTDHWRAYAVFLP